MTDKINTRNKFARKICTKMEKLNNDIKLLIKVDTALKNQSGGGIADAMRKIATIKAAQASPRFDTDNIDQEITQIGTVLTQNVRVIMNAFNDFEREIDAISQKAAVPIPIGTNDVDLTNINSAASQLASIITSQQPPP